jgi:glycosyltransferase involved in cell wall biosynthesis
MSPPPSFSVIVPAYNAAHTIEATIASALTQTCEDIELIVIDDGSTDETATRARAIDDPRLSVISQPNRGLPAARNVGIARSCADRLSFLDSDDLWLPDFLETAATTLDANPDAGFAYTDAYAFDSLSGKVRHRTAMGRQRPPVPAPADPGGFLMELLMRNFVYYSIVAPRSVLDAVGGYDESRRAAEDYDLSLRILTKGYRAVRMDGLHALYRLHSGQMTRSLAKMTEAVLDVYEGLPTADLPTDAHRQLLQRRIRETRRGLRRTTRVAARLAPQTTIARVKRAGIGESWYGPPPPEIAAAFPDLAATASS